MDTNALPENLNTEAEGQNNIEKPLQAEPELQAPEVLPVEPQPTSKPIEQGPSQVPATPVQPQADPIQTPQNDQPLQDTVIIEDETGASDALEKPWVDKAEKIIEDNKDNPYNEEEQQEDLQIEYLKNRFGKEIKKEE